MNKHKAMEMAMRLKRLLMEIRLLRKAISICLWLWVLLACSCWYGPGDPEYAFLFRNTTIRFGGINDTSVELKHKELSDNNIYIDLYSMLCNNDNEEKICIKVALIVTTENKDNSLKILLDGIKYTIDGTILQIESIEKNTIYKNTKLYSAMLSTDKSNLEFRKEHILKINLSQVILLNNKYIDAGELNTVTPPIFNDYFRLTRSQD